MGNVEVIQTPTCFSWLPHQTGGGVHLLPKGKRAAHAGELRYLRVNLDRISAKRLHAAPAYTGFQRQSQTPEPPILVAQIKSHAPCTFLPRDLSSGAKGFTLGTEMFLGLPLTSSLKKCSFYSILHIGPHIVVGFPRSIHAN